MNKPTLAELTAKLEAFFKDDNRTNVFKEMEQLEMIKSEVQHNYTYLEYYVYEYEELRKSHADAEAKFIARARTCNVYNLDVKSFPII